MSENTEKVEQVIIIGSGPAGLTAGLYTARSEMQPLLFTGTEIGGQVTLTMEVENYPGFPDGITGPELIQRMQKQAERFGCRVVVDTVTEVALDEHPFTIKTQSGKEYRCKSLIITTGARPRRLGVPKEKELTGRGVSYCATCDGFFFRGKEVAVVGGGDAAIEEALFLTKYVNKVKVIHRRNQLRAHLALQQRAFSNEKFEFIWDTVVTAINGDQRVTSLTLQNVQTGEESELLIDGVFVYVGHIPNSQLFAGKLDMDGRGYLITDRFMQTSVPGVYAAGEIQDSRFQQVATSVGQGCAAALEAEKFVAELEDRAYPGEP
ncbi:MAG: thioredoxin-disulfide reductase [Chloroflexi bacterium]|nr:thioredoxin-disulfide reductase [Chloroflexota bacterium]